MATERKSIEIGLKANISQLQQQLKRIPNITEAEVKKMTAALEKELKRSEQAAKKAAKAQEMSMKKLDKATQNAARSAKKMSKEFKTGMQNAGIAAGVVALGVVALAQDLADLTNELVDASTKTGLTAETLNGLKLAAEGAGLAFSDLEVGLVKMPKLMLEASMDGKKAAKTFGLLGIDVKKANGELKTSEQVFQEVVAGLKNVESAEKKAAIAAKLFGTTAGPKFLQAGIENLGAFTELANNFGVQTGPQATAAAADFQRQIALMGNVAKGSLQKIINAMGGDGGVNAIIKHGTEAIIYLGSVIETALMKPLSAVFGYMGAYPVLVSEFFEFMNTGSKGALDRANTISDLMRKDLEDALDSVATTFDVAGAKVDEFIKLREEANKATAAATPQTPDQEEKPIPALEKRQQINKSLEDSKKRQSEIQQSILDRQRSIRDMEIARLDPLLQIDAKYRDQINNLNTEHDKLIQIMETNINRLVFEKMSLEEKNQLQKENLAIVEAADLVLEERHQTLLARTEEIAEFEKQKAQETAQIKKELHEAEMNRLSTGLSASISGLSQFAEYGLQLLEMTGNKNKDLMNVLFRINQTAALGDIAMSTATAVAAAPAQYGPLYPLAVSTILAGAAAQTATVLAQSPPAHMGGYISESTQQEQKRTLLSGEAVLDRSTVSRIGGEQGVRDLQSGRSNQQIIVMNPWKHLDRYNRSAIKSQNSVLTSLNPKFGSGGY